MKNLQEATEKICELKGSLLAMECLLNAMALALPELQRQTARQQLKAEIEACRTVLLNAVVSERTFQQFERDALRVSSSLER